LKIFVEVLLFGVPTLEEDGPPKAEPGVGGIVDEPGVVEAGLAAPKTKGEAELLLLVALDGAPNVKGVDELLEPGGAGAEDEPNRPAPDD
jgi:hypothetical protein